MPVEVLLVERDAAAIDVRLIQKLSKASSVTVSITAENDGEAALGILADPQFKPALVITNMIQAKVGAPNLIERCVEKRIPVVVFGGCENPAHKAESLMLGVKEVVEKPSGMDEYTTALWDLIWKWTARETS